MHTLIAVCTTSNGGTRNKYCHAIIIIVGSRSSSSSNRNDGNGTTAFVQRCYRSTIGGHNWHRHSWRRKLLLLIGNANNATQSWKQQWMQFKGARTTLSFAVFESIRSEIAVGKFTWAKKRRRRFTGEWALSNPDLQSSFWQIFWILISAWECSFDCDANFNSHWTANWMDCVVTIWPEIENEKIARASIKCAILQWAFAQFEIGNFRSMKS